MNVDAANREPAAARRAPPPAPNAGARRRRSAGHMNSRPPTPGGENHAESPLLNGTSSCKLRIDAVY
jgi:hypothetical protein